MGGHNNGLAYWSDQLALARELHSATHRSPGHTSAARYIGAEGDLGVAWRVDSHTTLQFLTAYYKVGPYLRQTDPPGKDAKYFSVMAAYKF
jgi:hypothetical protein